MTKLLFNSFIFTFYSLSIQTINQCQKNFRNSKRQSYCWSWKVQGSIVWLSKFDFVYDVNGEKWKCEEEKRNFYSSLILVMTTNYWITNTTHKKLLRFHCVAQQRLRVTRPPFVRVRYCFALWHTCKIKIKEAKGKLH